MLANVNFVNSSTLVVAASFDDMAVSQFSRSGRTMQICHISPDIESILSLHLIIYKKGVSNQLVYYVFHPYDAFLCLNLYENTTLLEWTIGSDTTCNGPFIRYVAENVLEF